MQAENKSPQVRKEPVFRIFSAVRIVGDETFTRHQVQLFRDVILGPLEGEGFIITIDAGGVRLSRRPLRGLGNSCLCATD